MMEELYTLQELLLHALFVSVATLAFAASFYLLLRRGNAIAPEIIPPSRLRRWTAAFFAAVGASQLYWLLIRYGFLGSDPFHSTLLCTALDAVSSAPALLCTLMVSLQDRRRPLWPIAVASALTVIYLLVIYILDIRTTAFLAPPLLLIVIFCFVLVRAVRQYHRWLLDNYADLEHKEGRIIIGVMAAFVLTSAAYGLANDYFFFEVLIELTDILLIAVLLWRVETLQTLEEPADDDNIDATADSEKVDHRPDSIYEKLQTQLQQYCVDGQYYLKYDASLTLLVQLLGTNRSYLSKYFAQHGMTYNTYINGLRIEHFIRLYQERTAAKRDFTARQLAVESGFRSYSTFSAAFKQIKGQTVADWMNSNS